MTQKSLASKRGRKEGRRGRKKQLEECRVSVSQSKIPVSEDGCRLSNGRFSSPLFPVFLSASLPLPPPPLNPNSIRNLRPLLCVPFLAFAGRSVLSLPRRGRRPRKEQHNPDQSLDLHRSFLWSEEGKLRLGEEDFSPFLTPPPSGVARFPIFFFFLPLLLLLLFSR